MEFDKSTFHSTKIEFHIGKITFSLCEKQVFSLENQDLTMHPNSPKCTRESPRVHCIKIVVSIHIVCMTDVPLPIDEKNSFIPSNII